MKEKAKEDIKTAVEMMLAEAVEKDVLKEGMYIETLDMNCGVLGGQVCHIYHNVHQLHLHAQYGCAPRSHWLINLGERARIYLETTEKKVEHKS
jgi:hypothetical protein